VAKIWWYEGDGTSFKTEEASIKIPWCTCSDGPHLLKVKQVFNFEKAILFFNRKPTKCQPLISFIQPFSKEMTLHKANLGELPEDISKLRVYRGSVLRAYFYFEGGDSVY